MATMQRHVLILRNRGKRAARVSARGFILHGYRFVDDSFSEFLLLSVSHVCVYFSFAIKNKNNYKQAIYINIKQINIQIRFPKLDG